MSSWTLDIDGPLAVLTFVRAPMNRLNMGSLNELAAFLEDIARRRSELSVIALTGGIDGYFVASAEPSDLVQQPDGRMVWDLDAYQRTLSLLETIPQPTVALIDGQAWGAGCELALACSIRLGSQRTNIGQPESFLGIIGGTQRMVRTVGEPRAMEICVTGRILGADEALSAGLLHRVLPVPGFRPAAIDWCHRRLTRHPPAALAAAKAAILGTRSEFFTPGIERESATNAQLLSQPESQALIRAIPSP